MKLSDFDTQALDIPTHLVTVREFAKVLEVPDQMIHSYTTKGTLALNKEYGQKRVDISDEATLTWLVKYLAKHPEIKTQVVEFIGERVEMEDDTEEV